MNATKRKFNALLQGLNSSPRPSSASDQKPRKTADITAGIAAPESPFSSASPSQKKRRMSALAGDAASSSALSLASISSLRRPLQTPAPAAKAPEVASRYCPGDREQLLRRLASFQEITSWTPKPDRVSEVEWAKRGWVCHGRERVRCASCHKELVVKLNRKEQDGKEVSVLIASEIGRSRMSLDGSSRVMANMPCRGSACRKVCGSHCLFTPTGLLMEKARMRWYALIHAHLLTPPSYTNTF